MEQDVNLKNYIGEVYIEDVCAYTHSYIEKHNSEDKYWEYETGVVASLRAHKSGYMHFCWTAALTETLWYAYRGMIKEAIRYDLVTMVLAGIMFRISFVAGLLTMVVAAIIKGFHAIPLYYLKIRDAVEKRGLLMRSAVESPAAKASLEREGKPSVMRTIIYFIIKCFVAVCLDGVLYSVFAVLNV